MKSEQIVAGVDHAALGWAFSPGPSGPPPGPPGENHVAVSASPGPCALRGVLVGILVGFDARGVPMVAGPTGWRGDPRPARSLVVLGMADLGRDVVLSFEEDSPDKPIVMGLLQPPRPGSAGSPRSTSADVASPVEVRVDGEKVVLTAYKEIVLRCGEASITLTRAGKILIRGAYLSSSSTGMHRIKGGSVQIN
jgi:hypothetical protein